MNEARRTTTTTSVKRKKNTSETRQKHPNAKVFPAGRGNFSSFYFHGFSFRRIIFVVEQIKWQTNRTENNRITTWRHTTCGPTMYNFQDCTQWQRTMDDVLRMRWKPWEKRQNERRRKWRRRRRTEKKRNSMWMVRPTEMGCGKMREKKAANEATKSLKKIN